MSSVTVWLAASSCQEPGALMLSLSAAGGDGISELRRMALDGSGFALPSRQM